MDNRCFILSASQVSCQKPLCEDWLSEPIWYDQKYARAIEPNTKEFMSPAEARRMSKILKRTICSAFAALNKAGVNQPDAIITGTGMGCMENSEKFLVEMSNFGEHCLKPTLFMQSTHNTISSLIAIMLKCHGYNNTYSHRGISFESALLDAWLQIKSGSIQTALVGSHDEVTPFSARILEKTFPIYKFISETNVSIVASSKYNDINPLCEIISVELLHQPKPQEIADLIETESDIALMMGLNGTDENDMPYLKVLEELPNVGTIIKYKHLFGENFSSSAIAFYAAAHMLSKQVIPDYMLHLMNSTPELAIKEMILINHSDEADWSVVKLKRV